MFAGVSFLQVIGEFLGLLCIAELQFEFSFFGAENDRLAFHPADHIEGGAGFAAQSHFQKVILDAGFNRFAQFVLDFEEAVGRTETADALVRPLVVVISDPELDPLAGRIEALELGAGEKLLPDGFPEPLDFAEGHGMLGT
jgi:hypothetical protein